MTGLMETVESRRQAFHEFPQPFGNPANDGRDSHIPTAPTTGLRGGEKQRQKANRCGGRAYALPPPAERDPHRAARVTERRILRQVASGSCLLERNFTFRLILGLEYADSRVRDPSITSSQFSTRADKLNMQRAFRRAGLLARA